MANEVSVQKKMGIAGFLAQDKVKANIVSVVGEKSAPTFISSVVSAVQTNKELAKCSHASILSAALLGESLHLTPSPQLGQYYLVPYSGEAQFQMGAKGYKQLAIRSGQYRKIVTSNIKDGELKSYNPITEEFVFEPILDEKQRNELPTVGYYAMFVLNNGFTKEIYWSKEKMESHAKQYSKGYANDLKKGTAYTFWSKDFDGMAEKTMVRQLISKWGIMSIEMQKAFEGDMGVIGDDGNVHYVDNEHDAKEDALNDIEQTATEDFPIDTTATEVE